MYARELVRNLSNVSWIFLSMAVLARARVLIRWDQNSRAANAISEPSAAAGRGGERLHEFTMLINFMHAREGLFRSFS